MPAIERTSRASLDGTRRVDTGIAQKRHISFNSPSPIRTVVLPNIIEMTQRPKIASKAGHRILKISGACSLKIRYVDPDQMARNPSSAKITDGLRNARK